MIATPVWHLAQANHARLRAPLDAPMLAEFAAAVEPVNRLAERSPGFVWRLDAGTGHVAVDPADPLVVVNVSVWDSYHSLHEFVYRSRHGWYTRRRRRWFDRLPSPTTALWWIPAGHRPTLDEAVANLDRLRRYGPTPACFSLRSQFDAAGRPVRRPAQATAVRRS